MTRPFSFHLIRKTEQWIAKSPNLSTSLRFTHHLSYFSNRTEKTGFHILVVQNSWMNGVFVFVIWVYTLILDAISLDVAIEKASRLLTVMGANDAENCDNYLGSWVAAAIVDTNSWSTGNCAFCKNQDTFNLRKFYKNTWDFTGDTWYFRNGIIIAKSTLFQSIRCAARSL